MVSKVLGVGVGLFILAFVWTLTCLLCYLSLKAKKLRPLGIVGLLFSTLISAVLLNIPQSLNTSVSPQYYLVDNFFILRTTLLIILGLSLLAGISIVLLTHWMEPTLAKPLKNITPRCLSQ